MRDFLLRGRASTIAYLRTPIGWVTVVAWAALAAFVVATLAGPLLGLSVFLGTDLLATVSPWKEVVRSTATPSNVSVGDTIDSAVPQVALIVDSLKAGQFPAWNPYVGGGTELAGLPNSGVYSPLSLPWWILPYAYAPGAVKFLEIIAATVGMSLLLRRFELPSATWPIASLVFVSSGFMVAWTNWPQTRVAAFIPLLFWALDRAALRAKWSSVVGVGLVVCAMLLGGFPAILGYALYAGGIFVIVRSVRAHRSLRRLALATAVALGGVVFGVVLAAWQIVPFGINATTVIDLATRGQVPEFRLDWADLASTVVPELFDSTGTSSRVERLSYLGVGTVVLIAAFGLIPARRRRTISTTFFVVGALLSIVLVYVGGPILDAAQELPIFSSNYVARLRSMIGFFAAVLAGFGFAAILDGIPLREEWTAIRQYSRGRILRRSVQISAVFALFLITILTVVAALRQDRSPQFLVLREDVITYGVVALVASALVAAVWLVPRRFAQILAGLVLPVVLVVPASAVARDWWPHAAISTFYPQAPAFDYLAANIGQDRFLTVENAGLPGTSSLYRLRSATGHGSQTMEWKELLRSVDEKAERSLTYTTLSADALSDSFDSSILDRLGVRFVAAAPEVVPLGTVGPVTAGITEDAQADTADTTLVADGTTIVSGIFSGPASGVVIGISDLLAPAEGAEISIDLRDVETGEILASTSRWQVSWHLDSSFAIAAGAIPPDRTWRAEARLDGLSEDARIDATPAGVLRVKVIRPDPRAEVVHTGDLTIYERATAMPRIRWASDAIVESDPASRLAAMASADEDTREAVILDEAPSSEARSSGADGTATSRDVNTDGIDVSVRSEGPGWVVVEESLRRPGWSATLDGATVDIVPAEHAGGAIYVGGAGEHDIELRYDVPGMLPGALISIAGVAAIGIGVGVVIYRRRHSHRRQFASRAV